MQPTPVFWPGESHGQRSLVAAVKRGLQKLDTTEQMTYRTNKEGNSTGTAQLGSNETNT